MWQAACVPPKMGLELTLRNVVRAATYHFEVLKLKSLFCNFILCFVFSLYYALKSTLEK